MANVVRLHLSGHNYTHATATTLDDAAVVDLVARLSGTQGTWPQPPVQVAVATDAGAMTLVVYPHRVWVFGAWVAPATTTTTTSGGSGGTIGVGVSL